MNWRALISFVAFFAMIAGFLTYVGSLGIRVNPPENRIALSMDVPDINSLELDSNVLLRGIPIGKVTQIEADTSHATIHFYVDNRHKIPVDSVVRLENLSALGESYLEVEPQSTGGPTYTDGQRIATETIRQPASISELGTSVVRVLNQMNPAQLSNVLNEADKALPDPYAVLPNLERASLLLRNTTQDLNGRGMAVLDNSQSLLENAGFVGPALANAAPPLRDLGPAIQTLWNNGTAIGLRTDTPGNVWIFGRFLQRIQKLLDDRGSDIRVLTEPLTANINAIAASLTTINTSEVLANLLRVVPADGVINLHVTNDGGAIVPAPAGPPPTGGEPPNVGLPPAGAPIGQPAPPPPPFSGQVPSGDLPTSDEQTPTTQEGNGGN
ncbi:MlaD family protein [Mycolicibacterium porcinum]|uniref:MlaD family protein n=1 Tax=Mycolicibacterium porcinum TaxID=39693 RepID=UPI000430E07C|nr:MlaD family protein [Mycolicibacterium porcinum]ORB39010.1 mammalian cell entry protein [Mycolicibacterium porcinum]CDO30833.1 Mce family protein [Mycolicibacterium vulneris]